MSKWNSRRLAVFGVVFGVSTSLLLWGPLTADHWVDLMQWMGTIFFSADIGEKITQRGGTA